MYSTRLSATFSPKLGVLLVLNELGAKLVTLLRVCIVACVAKLVPNSFESHVKWWQIQVVIGLLAVDLPEPLWQITRNPFKTPSLRMNRNSSRLAFKSASACPPFLHSARSLARRNMDTTCFRETAHFPPREQPKSFSIDWILSSGHRKPALDSHSVYTQPTVIMRGALFPALTNGPFVAAFGSACVYAPHFSHHQSAAYRHSETRLHDGKSNI